jgi:multiple sugar transport system permease protein
MSTDTLTRTPPSQAPDRGGSQPGWWSPRWSVRAWRTARLVVTAALALLWLAPMLWAVDMSLKPEGETTAIPISWIPEAGFTLDAYRFVFELGDIPKWFLNTLIVTALVTALTLLTASMAGYGFSRYHFRGKGVLFALILAGIMVPPQILIVPLFDQMLDMGLVDTYWALILPPLANPIGIFLMRQFIEGLPSDLDNAARMDGCSELAIFRHIVLPLTKPALTVLAVLHLLNQWNSFLWPLVVTRSQDMQVLTVGIASLKGLLRADWGLIAAGALLSMVPLVMLFVLFQRYFVAASLFGAVKE